jgi:hypothetical protein
MAINCPYDDGKCTGQFVSQKKSKRSKSSLETDSWFIGCSRWWDKSKEGSHYFEGLKGDIDPVLLGKLFKGETVSN